MCGIVGYVGESQAAPILLEGLEKLEYRGYDSAGIAVYDGKKINMKKAMGRLKVLNELTHEASCFRVSLESVIPVGQRMAHRLISTLIRILIKIRVS